MKHPFFRRKGPRTAGREEFGREFVAEFLKQCGRADKHDVLATATALTARSIGRGRAHTRKAPIATTIFSSPAEARATSL